MTKAIPTIVGLSRTRRAPVGFDADPIVEGADVASTSNVDVACGRLRAVRRGGCASFRQPTEIARCLVLEDLLPQGRIGPPATSGRGDRTTEGRASTDGLDDSTRLAHPFALTSSGRSSSGSRSRAGQSRCARGARRYGVVPGKRELRARYLDPLQSGIPRAVLHSPIIL